MNPPQLGRSQKSRIVRALMRGAHPCRLTQITDEVLLDLAKMGRVVTNFSASRQKLESIAQRIANDVLQQLVEMRSIVDEIDKTKLTGTGFDNLSPQIKNFIIAGFRCDESARNDIAESFAAAVADRADATWRKDGNEVSELPARARKDLRRAIWKALESMK
jgi:hypothetical protein